jgi:pimeloyl-ACP methyl ester carboxylesterase
MAQSESSFEQYVQHDYAENGGVRLHYASYGAGPLVVFLHGFPDFWYSWRRQMAALGDSFRCVAPDLRGYNLSDQPKGREQYAMPRLVEDVVAVVQACGHRSAAVVGHDWGGAIAWSLAMARPEVVERLVILNLPHFRGLMRELAHNPAQQAASQYARNFQQEGAHRALSPEKLTFWVTDDDAKAKYLEAFQRSDIEAMLHYYKQNFPREPYTEAPASLFPKVQAPVLMMHGLKDPALLPGALNGTWEWVDNAFTLVTLPDAGHFIQQDAADYVSQAIRQWLGGPPAARLDDPAPWLR